MCFNGPAANQIYTPFLRDALFLVADSKERKTILETLFKTGQYSALEEALDARAKTLKKEYEECRQKYQLLLESAGTDNPAALKERIQEEKQQAKALEAQAAEAQKASAAALEALQQAQQIGRAHV